MGNGRKAGRRVIMGRGFNAQAVFGPAIVTPDEAGDISGAGIRTFVNGELRQTGKPSDIVCPLYTSPSPRD